MYILYIVYSVGIQKADFVVRWYEREVLGKFRMFRLVVNILYVTIIVF